MKIQNCVSWDYYFIHLAHHVKIKSPNPHRKIGAVLVSEFYRTNSTGYNDLPIGINNDIDWSDKELIKSVVVDAEVNCILYADPTTDFKTCILYMTHSPKHSNVKILATTGIKKIYYDECCEDICKTQKLCCYFNIELIKYEPRDILVIGSSS